MQGLAENITNPALLFFILGILAVQFNSDLKIPESSSKFISIYLLFSIGFKGGQELSHSHIDSELLWSLAGGVMMATVIPVASFFLLKRKLSVANAGAIAAAYGSVSAVTFVTAISFLEFQRQAFSGHMIAVMAAMEAPAIIVGVLLVNVYRKDADSATSLKKCLELVKHSLTNGSVILILGSLVIGYLASAKQAEGIAPFTTDIFKGFLAVFLLDMGLTSGKQLSVMGKRGIVPYVFAIAMPFIHGTLALCLAMQITESPGNQLLFALLGASASYIAVPAAMKNAVPQANPSLYLPMALGITFPVNVIVGIPFYYMLIQYFQ